MVPTQYVSGITQRGDKRQGENEKPQQINCYFLCSHRAHFFGLFLGEMSSRNRPYSIHPTDFAYEPFLSVSNQRQSPFIGSQPGKGDAPTEAKTEAKFIHLP